MTRGQSSYLISVILNLLYAELGQWHVQIIKIFHETISIQSPLPPSPIIFVLTFSSLLSQEWFMGYPERRSSDLRIVIFYLAQSQVQKYDPNFLPVDKGACFVCLATLLRGTIIQRYDGNFSANGQPLSSPSTWPPARAIKNTVKRLLEFPELTHTAVSKNHLV